MSWFLANPLFAWLLPLASLPVLFHLFFKLKKRPRIFPTLMFFDQIDPRLSARRQIRQWLVLLLRTLFLVSLLLALARPTALIGGLGGGGRVSVVLLLDNSGSMSGPPLQTALEAARALTARLAPSDPVGIVTLVEDPTVALPDGLDSDKTAVKSALERIRPTEASGQPALALQRAFALLETSDATRHEVHIFTDAQQTEWGQAAPDPRPPRAGTTITVHRFPNPLADADNVSLARLEWPSQRLLAGRAVPLRLTIANAGPRDVGARLHWADDADNRGTIELALPARSEKILTLLLPATTTGRHWVQTWLDGDGFDADNRAAATFVCAERSPVLFVGAPTDFGLLPLAISPTADGSLSGLVPAFGTVADLAEKKPLLVVAPWDRAEALRDHLERGGNLLLSPGASPVLPAWVPVSAEPLQTSPQGAPVLIHRFDAAIWTDLRDDKGEVSWRGVRALRFHPLRPRDESASVFGLDDGRALFVEQRHGDGMLFVSGIGFDATWSSLPLRAAFLAIAQNMALARAEPPEPVHLAGHRPAPGAAGESLSIRSLAGSPLQWVGDAAHPPVLPRAGIYQLQLPHQTRYLGVGGAPAEGVPRFITSGELPALAGLRYSVRDFTGLDPFVNQTESIRRGLDLFLPLLLLALMLWALEAWAANPLPRRVIATAPGARAAGPRPVSPPLEARS
jgi:hypothetical protein